MLLLWQRAGCGWPLQPALLAVYSKMLGWLGGGRHRPMLPPVCLRARTRSHLCSCCAYSTRWRAPCARARGRSCT